MDLANSPTRWFRPRFSLRGLLIVVALLAACLAGFVRWRSAKQREVAAAEKILNRGGNPGRISLQHRSSWIQPLAIVLPKECFESVT